MNLGSGHFENFCSYPVLDFDFGNKGLSLIAGRTGSGKSTFLDASCWTLYGQTSKEGNADEVRPLWGSEQPTIGVQEVYLPDGKITVTRTRGKSTQNDLYWTEEALPENQIRRKDANETQKALEERLGVPYELFLMVAYFHQFSKADAFFVAKAKDRRSVFERIASLQLPVRIDAAVSESKKEVKAQQAIKELELSKITGRADQAREQVNNIRASIVDWDTRAAAKIQKLQIDAASFETGKADQLARILGQLEALDREIVEPKDFADRLAQNKIQRDQIEALRPKHAAAVRAQGVIATKTAKLTSECDGLTKQITKLTAPGDPICPTCLGPSDNPNKHKHIAEMEARVSKLKHEINDQCIETEKLEDEANRFATALAAGPKLVKDLEKIQKEQTANNALIDRFEALKVQYATVNASVNTYADQLTKEQAQVNPFREQLAQVESSVRSYEETKSALSAEIKVLAHRVSSLTRLHDFTLLARGRLLEKAVKGIEGSTNLYLEKFFDGALRVKFTVDADKLEVEIQKGGYPCSFRQLSGGQRRMLALSFWASVRTAAMNKAGVHVGNLFFDESLNGLDDDLKAKAFGFFQHLETECPSIVLIDHCTAFKSYFSNQWRVIMTGDTSEIENVEGAGSEAA